MRNVKLAVIICTYRREKYIWNSLNVFNASDFNDPASKYYGCLHAYVIDNAHTLEEISDDLITVTYNPRGNVGGAGGFQYGIECVRDSKQAFSHVVFIDDDAEFKIESFYLVYDFLSNLDDKYVDRPIAGRMFRTDDRSIQYTAAEIWNKGDIRHVGFNKPEGEIALEPDAQYDSEAEYTGWWLACFPYSFVKDNDVMPFFIHCDDVEYGLRCGEKPIILKGFQVWHDTYENRQTPIMTYYDFRNPLFVNEKYGLIDSYKKVYDNWKEAITKYHVAGQFDYEYYLIKGLYDFTRGLGWLYAIHPGKYHEKLKNAGISKYKNAFLWRCAAIKFKKKFL